MAQVPMLQVAEEVQIIGDTLVGNFHPHLAQVRILYLFTDTQKRHKDRVVIATTSLMNPLSRFLASGMDSVESGHQVLMVVEMVAWSQLDSKQQRRLIDSQLEQIKVFVKNGFDWIVLPQDKSVDEYSESKLGFITPDLTDFAAIIKRYGLPSGEREGAAIQEIKNFQIPLPELRVVVSSN